MLYFDGPGAHRDFVRLGREHPAGRIGVLAEAVRAYQAKHQRPPAPLAEPPPYRVRCRLARTKAAWRSDLEAFDAWIGGAELRPRVISIVLAEHLQNMNMNEMGGVVLDLAQGKAEVYTAPRRRRLPEIPTLPATERSSLAVSRVS